MPAMLEDPTAPVIYRTSGVPPYPTPLSSEIPSSITPRQVTLRDRITIASLLPFSSPSTIPPRLLSYLCQQLNLEIEKGDTYPMIATMAESSFGTYWFQNFGAVMILGEIGVEDYVHEVWRMEKQGVKWEECALGSFYVKPNYPGRSSHVCNGGFLVTEAARNKGVGRLMGEGYLEWAPRLGYSYSVFNLVYETNVASCRIWDALGFKRIGRVKACGNLRSHPEGLVDAIMYGRDLGPEGEDYVSEERFDKIRFYLKHGKYPNGADRAEKSRLRSAATHYKLLPPEDGREGEEDAERLMLRDKEVVSDPQRQYEIARQVHVSGQHGGINKTTATIAEKFHWVRIKETVSLVIKNCPDCKDSAAKIPTPSRSGLSNGSDNNTFNPSAAISSIGQSMSTKNNPNLTPHGSTTDTTMYDRLVDFAQTTTHQHPESQNPIMASPLGSGSGDIGGGSSVSGRAPMAHMGPMASGSLSQYAGIPLDPQLMAAHSQQQQRQSQPPYQTQTHALLHDHQSPQHQQLRRPHETQQNPFFTHTGHPTHLSSPSHHPHPQSLHGPLDPQKQSDGIGQLEAYNSHSRTGDGVVNGGLSGGHNGEGDEDAQFDVDIDVDMGGDDVGADDDIGQEGTGAEEGGADEDEDDDDDTRLATDRHLRVGDDPLGVR